MTSVFEYDRDAIRVKARFFTASASAKESSQTKESEIRKFSVDPNLTSYDTLRSLLSRAFDLKDDLDESFRISYYCANEWLPMLSDWDLDAAIISASDPALQLALVKASQREKVTLRTSLELKNTDGNLTSTASNTNESAISPTAAAAQEAIHQLFVTSKRDGANFLRSTIPALTGKLSKMMAEPSVTTTAPNVQAKRNSTDLKPALSDKDFRSFLDNVGELVRPRELRIVVYKGGVEPQLRKVVWKHLLGVYPQGLDGRQRLDYMRQMSQDYDKLKQSWITICSNAPGGVVNDDIKMVTNMVRKDVLRTDRQHKFYSGDNNENITTLYNILTTYALHHPSIGYCQGMSDLLSPLLVTMMDEAHAYVCFCALMQRLKKNFMVDGQAMTKMFQHLSEGLMYYDPEFFAYLKINQADDLLFCYRWLLLEMKREFQFEDSLQVLETLWASLPPTYASKQGLPLYETKLNGQEKSSEKVDSSNSTPRKETVYAKMVSLRRRTTSGDLKRILSNPMAVARANKKKEERSRIHSDSSAAVASSTAAASPIANKTSEEPPLKITDLKDFSKLTSGSGGGVKETVSASSSNTSLSKSSSFENDPFDSDNIGYLNGGSCGAGGNPDTTTIVCDRLPEPIEFGDGNPFLMFICIACLLQHRNQIINGRFDYQEIAMFFDKMVRKHDVRKTLALARKLFAEYLNDDWATMTGSEVNKDSDNNIKASAC